jgi:hypothetical protein
MKAISLWQPWASLIACGAKPYETRSWAPPRKLIGQTIAIHAAKKIDREAAEFAEELVYGQHGHDLGDRLEASWGGDQCCDELMGKFGNALMPIGCVVCTARLDAAYLLGEKMDGIPAARVVRALGHETRAVAYDGFGDYAVGRWAWLLNNVRPLTPPAPARGAQGFFDLSQGWLTGGRRMTGQPVRLQLSRAPGFRLQNASRAVNGLPAIKCDRTTRWGNPWRVGAPVDLDRARCWGWKINRPDFVCIDATQARSRFAHALLWDAAIHDHVRTQLSGRNLACWCGRTEPCHVDVLLILARSTPEQIDYFHLMQDEILRIAGEELMRAAQEMSA